MKIKDIGRVVTGKTPLTGVNEYYGGNIMFISPSDLHEIGRASCRERV